MFTVWKDEYRVGDDEIDKHHQQLIRYIQLLEDPKIRNEGDKDFVDMLVQGLADYAVYHFDAEETAMVKAGYPQLEAHRVEHAEFAKDMEIFRQAFGQGSARLEKALLGYLRDWLLTHILTTDKAFGDWVASRRGHGAETLPGSVRG